MRRHRLLTLLLTAALAGCGSSSSKPGESPSNVDAPPAQVLGQVRLLGAADSAGAQVWLDAGAPVTTDADGWYFFNAAPQGTHTLHVKRGEWQETVPDFVVAAGAGPQIRADGTLHPLPLLEVPAGSAVVRGNLEALGSFSTAPSGAVEFTGPGSDPSRFDLLVAGKEDDAARRVALGLRSPYRERFSPDGSHLLYATEDCLYDDGGVLLTGTPLEIVPVAGGAPTRLADSAFCDRIGFTPSGDHVVYQLDGTDPAPLRSVPAAGGPAVDLGQGRIAQIDDARALVIRTSDTAGGELWIVSLADGTGTLLAAHAGDARFVNGGAHVLYWRRDVGQQRSFAAVVPAAGGTARELGMTGQGGFAVTSAGKIAWIDRNALDPVAQTYEVKVADLAAGTDATVLGTTTALGLVLTPDEGEVLVIGAVQAPPPTWPAGRARLLRALDALRLADGARRTLAARAYDRAAPSQLLGYQPYDPYPTYLTEEVPPLVSLAADGATVYFYGWSDDPDPVSGLYRVSLDGGAPARIGRDDWYVLTPETVIYFADPVEGEDPTDPVLARAPHAGGAPTALARHLASGGTLSPDGAHLAFMAEDAWPMDTYCGTMFVAPTAAAGGPAVPVMRRSMYPAWAGNDTFYAYGCQNAAPYAWRDGIYRLTVP